MRVLCATRPGWVTSQSSSRTGSSLTSPLISRTILSAPEIFEALQAERSQAAATREPGEAESRHRHGTLSVALSGWRGATPPPCAPSGHSDQARARTRQAFVVQLGPGG